jgi:hypothetical protein
MIFKSNEAWIDEENILENDIAICEDLGYIFKKIKNKIVAIHFLFL